MTTTTVIKNKIMQNTRLQRQSKKPDPDAPRHPTMSVLRSFLALRKTSNLKKIKGFTFIEIAIVIGIIAAAVAIAISVGNSVRQGHKAGQAVAEIATAFEAAHSMFAARHGYPGVSSAVVAGSSKIPAAMVKSGQLYNIFGFKITFVDQSFSVASPGATRLLMTYTAGVTAEMCVDIATKLIKTYQVVEVNIAPIHSVADAISACIPGAVIWVATR